MPCKPKTGSDPYPDRSGTRPAFPGAVVVRRRGSRRAVAAGVLLLAGLAAAAACGADEGEPAHAADLLPPSTVLFVEIDDPARLVETALGHPLRDGAERHPAVRQAREGKAYLQFKAAVAVLEAQLGQTWPRLVAAAAGEGVTFAYDTRTEGRLLLLRGRDAETQQQLVDALVELARFAARQSGGEAFRVESGSYRDVVTHTIRASRLAVVDRWLLITDKEPLLRYVVDRFREPSDDALADQESFVAARREEDDGWTARGYLNLEALREAGVGRRISRAASENVLGEWLAGGVLEAVQRAPWLAAGLRVERPGTRLVLRAPFDRESISDRRDYFFGDARGAAPTPLPVEGALLTFRAHRDLAAFWRVAGELFDDSVNDQFAEADANLSALFAGRQFGPDVLGRVRPGLQIVAARPPRPDGEPRDLNGWPALAVVLQFQDSAQLGDEMIRVFRSLVEFLNVVAERENRTVLELRSETAEPYEIVTARFPTGADRPRRAIEAGLSPSVALVGDRMIVASTAELARALARAALRDAEGAPEQAAEQGEGDANVVNSRVEVDFGVLGAVLSEHRDALIGRFADAEGRPQAAAEADVDMLIELLALWRDATLELSSDDSFLRLEARLRR